MLAVGTVSMLTCGEVGHLADSLLGHPTSTAQGGIDHRHMEPGHCDPHLLDPTQAAINLDKITGPLKRELKALAAQLCHRIHRAFLTSAGISFIFCHLIWVVALTHRRPSDRPPGELLMASSPPV